MKGHTGGTTSFGVGVIHTMCSKQKLNTKSSTESEIVSASDYVTHMIWLSRFMEDMGYPMKKKVLYQDNKSAIQILKNGRMSSSRRSRHMDIKYFFLKDVLQREGIDLEYCPTAQMLVDFFTKPLQGKLFKLMRDVIMGNTPFTMEERVGETKSEVDKFS